MWVIIAIAILVLVIFLCLSIPLRFTLYLDTDKAPMFRVRIIWFFGLIDRVVEHSPQRAKRKGRAKSKKKAKLRVTGSQIYDAIGVAYRIFKTEGFIKQLRQLGKGLLRCINIEDLKANLRFETANPLYSGIAFAIAAPVNMLFKRLPYEISIWPSFTTRHFIDGQAQINLMTRPIKLLSTLSRFACSKPVIKAYRILATAKWKQKK